MMKVHFIVNEQAGGKKGKRIWRQVQRKIAFPYELLLTTGPLAASRYVQAIERQMEAQLIVVIGGDGTIHEVVNGAQGRDDLIVSFMKAGSGNDFARGIQNFNSYEEIVSFMQKSERLKKWIDVATVQSNYVNKSFVNNCGLGFDAYVCSLVNQSKVKKFFNQLRLGKLSYVYVMIKALFTYKPFQLELEIDGQSKKHFDNVWFVAVSNQPYFGGGMKISPDSKIDDGQLEITVVHALPSWRFLLLFFTVYNGSHLNYKEVVYMSAKEIRCTISEPVHCHTDGEVVFTSDQEYAIFVSRGELIVPA